MTEDSDEAWLNQVDTLVRLSPEFEKVVFVQYRDHVMYNRTSADLMQPQTREAIGWLVHEAESYIIISWDRDAGPPTLHGGDPKASGLVLLKSDVQRMIAFSPAHQPHSGLNLKSKQAIQGPEYAFRPSERKTHSSKGGRTL
jgi:hypothetical protein